MAEDGRGIVFGYKKRSFLVYKLQENALIICICVKYDLTKIDLYILELIPFDKILLAKEAYSFTCSLVDSHMLKAP